MSYQRGTSFKGKPVLKLTSSGNANLTPWESRPHAYREPALQMLSELPDLCNSDIAESRLLVSCGFEDSRLQAWKM